MTTTVVVVLGALSGGFVTGLAGFGTGLTALAFWLHVVNPVVAAALVVSCSVVGQAQSLYTVRRAITWRRAWPFLAGGIVGVPVGVASTLTGPTTHFRQPDPQFDALYEELPNFHEVLDEHLLSVSVDPA